MAGISRAKDLGRKASSMNLYAEVLPPQQQDVLRQLGHVTRKLGYYLGGGTAVAIHLGHRRSVDLDWFTEGRMDDPMRLAAHIRDEGVGLEVRSVDRGTLDAMLGTVRLSFLDYGYPLLGPLIHWPSFDCQLASIDDLAAMKLLAIEQRGARRTSWTSMRSANTDFRLLACLSSTAENSPWRTSFA